jgi:membrane associated rhomboid family serine protease
MILPIRTDSPLRGRPWMNWALLLVTLGLGAAEACTEQFRAPTWINHFQLSGRVPVLGTFFSYAFIHANWVHLLENLLALYIFGNNVNDRLGHVGYLAFYLAGAVFAGIGFVIADTSGLPVIGASGAVMAVMGAYLALYPRSNITILSVLFFVGTFEVPSMYLIIIFFGLDLIGNLTGSVSVAHMAHISGMLFGFGMGMGLLVARLLPRDPFDFLALVQRWHRRREYKNLVRRGYNPFGYVAHQPPARPEKATADPEAADPNLERIRELRAEINEAIAHHNLPHAAIMFLDLRNLDPRQVLARQAQLDVANQLASQQFFPQAADAYEQFLRHYPNFEQIEQVQLMLGLICGRYLGQYDRAKSLLTTALRGLHGDRELSMAKAELERIQPHVGAEK